MSEETTEKETKETKGEAFKRLAKIRTANVIKAIRLLGKTANADSYEYTPDQVDQIMAAIEGECDKVYKLFKGIVPEDEDLFDFDEGR